jgi:hypothetical protein
MGSTYCPTDRFDVLPAGTEPEDVPEMRGAVPLIMQTEEHDEDIHLPQFSKSAMIYGFEADEAQDQDDATFARFSRDVLGNSSGYVSGDSDVPQGQDTIVMTGDMTIVPDDAPEAVAPPTIEFKTWSGNWSA